MLNNQYNYKISDIINKILNNYIVIDGKIFSLIDKDNTSFLYINFNYVSLVNITFNFEFNNGCYFYG